MSVFTPLDQFTFHHTLAEAPGTSLVFFTRAGCGSCKRWRQVIAAYLPSDPALRVFEVDAEREAALTREFDLFHLPALFLYRNGHFHAPIECEASVARLTAAISAALAAAPRESP